MRHYIVCQQSGKEESVQSCETASIPFSSDRDKAWRCDWTAAPSNLGPLFDGSMDYLREKKMLPLAPISTIFKVGF